MTCPSCQAPARAGQRFCRVCGSALAPSGAEEKTVAAPAPALAAAQDKLVAAPEPALAAPGAAQERTVAQPVPRPGAAEEKTAQVPRVPRARSLLFADDEPAAQTPSVPVGPAGAPCELFGAPARGRRLCVDCDPPAPARAPR